MSSEPSNLSEGYRRLAGRMILRAIQDLLKPKYSIEALAWLNGGNARLTFQLCAHVLGFDEEVLRQAILKTADAR
jgi:hypothetical protein